MERKNNRLKGYDYSRPGRYFVTICTKDKGNIFGEIENEIMVLNEIGKITDYTWKDLPNHNDNITLNEYIIMPDHVHGIIMINESNDNDREGLDPPLQNIMD